MSTISGHEQFKGKVSIQTHTLNPMLITTEAIHITMYIKTAWIEAH